MGCRRADFEGGYIFWYNGKAQAYKFDQTPQSHGAIGVGQGFYNQKIAEADQRFIQAFSQYNLGSKGVKPIQNDDYDGSVHQWRGYLVQDFAGSSVRGDLIIDPKTNLSYWIEGQALDEFSKSGHEILHPSLAQAYTNYGGSNKLGNPINDLHEWRGCQVQDFYGGSDGRGILMTWNNTIYYIPGKDGVAQKYFDNEWLGKPKGWSESHKRFEFDRGYIAVNQSVAEVYLEPLLKSNPSVDIPLQGFYHPFKGTGSLTQGWNGIKSHNGNERYAIDFDNGFGSDVYAMHSGKVIKVIKDFNDDGRDDPAWANKANLIYIQDDNGYISKYLHLEKESALVQEGAWVNAGQVIAKQGHSGWSTASHLHVEVDSQKIDAKGNLVFDAKGIPKPDVSLPFQMVTIDGKSFYPT